MQNPHYPDSPMPTAINDGGSVFPKAVGDLGGMSLRDWFAGMAMQGMLAQTSSGFWSETRSPSDEACKLKKEVAVFISEEAFKQADAMIAQRERKP